LEKAYQKLQKCAIKMVTPMRSFTFIYHKAFIKKSIPKFMLVKTRKSIAIKLLTKLFLSVFCLIGIFLFVSCSLAPDYVKGSLPVPLTLLDVNGSLGESDFLPGEDEAFAEFFPEPRLMELNKLSFLNNRDLRLALLAISEARENSSIARSQRFPTVEIQSGVKVEGGPTMETMKNYSVEGMLPAFELDLFGKLKNMEQAAFEEYLSSYENYRAFRISLISSVAEAYLEHRLLSEKETLTGNTLKVYRNSLAFIENRIINGLSSLLDLEEAKAQVDFAEAELLNIKIQKTRSENALNLLVGDFNTDNSNNTLPSPKKLKDIVPKNLLKTSISSNALLRRPDILAAEHMLIAKNYDIGVARSAFFPKISLTGAFSFMSTDLNNLFVSSGNSWNYNPVLTVPVFTAGKNKANLELSRIRKEVAMVNYEKAIQTAFKETLDTLLTIEDLSNQLIARQKYLATQRRVLELAASRYQSGGTISYLEVLDAQRGVFAAEGDVLEARKNLLSAHISLFAALGGGADSEEITLPEIPHGPKELIDENEENKNIKK
jgi:NodT family efflux transporter outer membrane factor (OMF) lipoprotein